VHIDYHLHRLHELPLQLLKLPGIGPGEARPEEKSIIRRDAKVLFLGERSESSLSAIIFLGKKGKNKIDFPRVDKVFIQMFKNRFRRADGWREACSVDLRNTRVDG
jgi:hypothetical protein